MSGKIGHNLSELKWTLTGWQPFLWRLGQPVELGTSPAAEVYPITISVPGSVQESLRDAKLIPDWNLGLGHRQCEWVENLHWVYETRLPDDWIAPGKTIRLKCLGLDGSGWIRLNGVDVGEFNVSHRPWNYELTSHLKDKGNILQIIFDCPPRWLGQFGYTSKMTQWKVRFNYFWDWTCRLVQIGVWDDILLEITDGQEIREFRAIADVRNDLNDCFVQIWGQIDYVNDCRVQLILENDNRIIREQIISAEEFNAQNIIWSGLQVELWWPNLQGPQPLYTLRCVLLDAQGMRLGEKIHRVGFRNVSWKPCKDAPENADPWVCVVNNKPIFLQGANWVPIRPNFADVTEDDYQKRLMLYRDLGFNILRVWGGAILEKEIFYNLCDELGIMVWQEFPLSSSGCEDYPPDDEPFIREMKLVAESYIQRRQHHPSLILWCGGNELITRDGSYVPVGIEHPLLTMLEDIVKREDSTRRFLPASPSGPRVHGRKENLGKGVHWDVHGPWNLPGSMSEWEDYWRNDDALFRSEVGTPGSSSADLIRRYSGEYDPMPPTSENPLWRRHTNWWVDYPTLVKEHGRTPKDIEEYVAWSQDRQKQALAFVVKICKERFPGCGGIILWMGHDCFPCNSNTSIIDFEGKPKPAALAVAETFRTPL
ncbi:MAG: glycoside hydrolase family 2 TIM barrel-domain containing protein [Phycisphaerae bacterium]